MDQEETQGKQMDQKESQGTHMDQGALDIPSDGDDQHILVNATLLNAESLVEMGPRLKAMVKEDDELIPDHTAKNLTDSASSWPAARTCDRMRSVYGWGGMLIVMVGRKVWGG